MNRALQKFALFCAYGKLYEVRVGAEQSALCGPAARRSLLLVCQGCMCSSSSWPLLNEPHRIMTKPVYTICEQQRRRSVCASTQSDQFLCYFTPTVSISNISRLLLVCIAELVGQGLVLPDRTTRKTGFLVTWLKYHSGVAAWESLSTTKYDYPESKNKYSMNFWNELANRMLKPLHSKSFRGIVIKMTCTSRSSRIWSLGGSHDSPVLEAFRDENYIISYI